MDHYEANPKSYRPRSGKTHAAQHAMHGTLKHAVRVPDGRGGFKLEKMKIALQKGLIKLKN